MDKAAFGPVWLLDTRVADVVTETLLHGECGRQFYQLRAWVIMPNHVHGVLRPKTSLPVITRWLKGSSARKANLILGRTGEAFWQDGPYRALRGAQSGQRWLGSRSKRLALVQRAVGRRKRLPHRSR